MRVMGRKGKAWDRWRAAARFIDLHKTKVTIREATRVVEAVKPSVDQVLREMLVEVSDDWPPREIDHAPKVKYLNPDTWII